MVSMASLMAMDTLKWREKYTLEEKLFILYEKHIHTDTILQIGKGFKNYKIEVHGAILIANSQYFEDQIEKLSNRENSSSKKIVIVLDEQNQSIETIRKFIKTLYINKFEPTSVEEAIDLLKLSYFYDCRKQIELLIGFLYKNITLNNAVDIFKCSSKFKLDTKNFYNVILDYVAANVKEIFDDNEITLASLSENEFREILSYDGLMINEIQLLKFLVDWGTFKCKTDGTVMSAENVKKNIRGLIELIRFPLMSLKEFINVVIPTKILSIDEENQIFKYLSKTMYASPIEKTWSWKIGVKKSFSMKFSIYERLLYQEIYFSDRYTKKASDILSSKFSIRFQTGKPIDLFGLEIYVGKDAWKYFGLKNMNELLGYEVETEITNISTSTPIPIIKSENILLENEELADVIVVRYAEGVRINPVASYTLKYIVKCRTATKALSNPSMETTTVTNRKSHDDIAAYNSNRKVSFYFWEEEHSQLPKKCFYLIKILYKMVEPRQIIKFLRLKDSEVN